MLDKGFLNDIRLSWKAKGLLAYMLSLPDDWSFCISDLATHSKCSRESTANIMFTKCRGELTEVNLGKWNSQCSKRHKLNRLVGLLVTMGIIFTLPQEIVPIMLKLSGVKVRSWLLLYIFQRTSNYLYASSLCLLV